MGTAPLSSIFVYGSANLAGLSTLDQVISSQHEIDSQERRSFEAAARSEAPAPASASGALESVNRLIV